MGGMAPRINNHGQFDFGHQSASAGLSREGEYVIEVTDNYGNVVAFYRIMVGQIYVPDVVGQTQTAAQTAITSAGLTVGRVTLIYSPINTAGTVISQNPIPGVSAAAGTAVNLVVSGAPDGPDTSVFFDGLTEISRGSQVKFSQSIGYYDIGLIDQQTVNFSIVSSVERDAWIIFTGKNTSQEARDFRILEPDGWGDLMEVLPGQVRQFVQPIHLRQGNNVVRFYNGARPIAPILVNAKVVFVEPPDEYEDIVSPTKIDTYHWISKRFDLDLNASFLSGVSDDFIRRFLADFDKAYEDYKELTGFVPINERKIYIWNNPEEQYAWARGGGGQIIMSSNWNAVGIFREMQAHNSTFSFGLYHELGHNFAVGAANGITWISKIDGEFAANFILLYAVDVNNITDWERNGATGLDGYRDVFASFLAIDPNASDQPYVTLMDIIKVIGWEPVKQTLKNTRSNVDGKWNNWLGFTDTLSFYAGLDVKSLVPSADWNRVKYTCDNIFR